MTTSPQKIETEDEILSQRRQSVGPVTKSRGNLVQTKLEFLGNIKFTRNTDEKELQEILNESKQNKERAEITQICVQNV